MDPGTGRLRRVVASAALVAALAAPAPAAADEPAPGWSDAAELSFVVTSGNSSAQTFGFKNALARAWERSSFELKAGGVRVESRTINAFAVGSSQSFRVEDSETTVTAENYFLNGRYDRKITDRFFWYAGAGWDRNRFAGIENRYIGIGGVGNVWLDREDLKFRTDYALTLTRQRNVVFDPDFDETFAGVRASWAYLNALGATTVYTNTLVVDDNLEDTPDLRADMTNSVAVSMNDHLALKVGLQLLYDNRPSLKRIELRATPDGPATGEVDVELDELDVIFTTALVVNF